MAYHKTAVTPLYTGVTAVLNSAIEVKTLISSSESLSCSA